jgi:hypothetical protein
MDLRLARSGAKMGCWSEQMNHRASRSRPLARERLSADCPELAGRRCAVRLVLAATLGGMLALSTLGCHGSVPLRAAVETPEPLPRMVHQSGGTDVLQLPAGQIPGMTISEVRNVGLPDILEANGQIAFDDRRVSTIVSRVTGRIEQTRVSQWDIVKRGQLIKQIVLRDCRQRVVTILYLDEPERRAHRQERRGWPLGEV